MNVIPSSTGNNTSDCQLTRGGSDQRKMNYIMVSQNVQWVGLAEKSKVSGILESCIMVKEHRAKAKNNAV